jgi:hypothetical protein
MIMIFWVLTPFRLVGNASGSGGKKNILVPILGSGGIYIGSEEGKAFMSFDHI